MSRLLTKVAERARNLPKDIRLVPISRDTASAIIKEYAHQAGWRIVAVSQTSDSLIVWARTPTRSPFRLVASRAPQLCVWKVLHHNTHVELEMTFAFTTGYRLLRYLLVWAPLALCLPLLYVPPPAGIGAVGYFWLLGAPVAIAFGALLSLFSPTKYYTFADAFFSFAVRVTGTQSRTVHAAMYPPDLAIIGLFIPAILLSLVPAIARNYPDPTFPDALLLALALAGVFLGALLLVDLARPELLETAARGDFSIHFALSFPFSLYSLNTLGLISLFRGSWDVDFFLYCILPSSLLVACLTIAWSIDLLVLKVRFMHCQPSESQSSRISFVAVAMISLLWFGLSIFNLGGILFSLIGLEYCIFGENRILANEFTKVLGSLPQQPYIRVLLGIYSLPLLLIFFLFFLTWLDELARINSLKISHPVSANLIQKVRSVSSSAGIKPPLIVIEQDNRILADVRFVLGINGVVSVTTAALAHLTEEELEALLAHEIWHLKRHSLILWFLTALSKLTLFGGSFLAVLLNTRELEHKADAFALTHLERRSPLRAKTVLTSALNKILVVNSFTERPPMSSPVLAFAGDDSMLNHRRTTFRNRMRILNNVYFGDWTLSYLHPTINERIRRIEATNAGLSS